MALHFLEPPLALLAISQPEATHHLELYEQGGERFLRLWLGGQAPGAHVIAKMTRAQALALAEAAEALAQRISD